MSYRIKEKKSSKKKRKRRKEYNDIKYFEREKKSNHLYNLDERNLSLIYKVCKSIFKTFIKVCFILFVHLLMNIYIYIYTHIEKTFVWMI